MSVIAEVIIRDAIEFYMEKKNSSLENAVAWIQKFYSKSHKITVENNEVIIELIQ